jgi:dihydrofolate reductase
MVGAPGTLDKWNSKHFADEMREEVRAGVGQADAVLPGRRTYQLFSGYWPGKAGSVPMADFMNY